MGAKFTPSIANLFMAEWEDKTIFKEQRSELVFYKHFIDDLFFIWDGTSDSLEVFIRSLNNNRNNIKLISDWHKDEINFLDVNIYRLNDRLETKVYFKKTDRNSYLPISSGHHPLWLRNIPKGQIMRVKRNCSEDAQFLAQSKILTKRFEARGYDPEILKRVVEEVALIPRITCLQEANPVGSEVLLAEKNHNREWGFISQFHAQYKEVEEIFKKHWHILLMDKKLTTVLPAVPQFIYRKTTSFGNRIVKKVIDPPKCPQTFWEQEV